MRITDVDTLLAYLDSTHARTARVIRCVPDDLLDWAPAAGKFSFGDVVRHLATIERYMYAENAHGRPSRYPGHHRELADGYDSTFAFYEALHIESRALFAQLDGAALERKTETPAGTPITTWKWLRAMFEHEAHHRGQLYLMLGMNGVPTPPLFGLTSEDVRERSSSAARCTK